MRRFSSSTLNPFGAILGRAAGALAGSVVDRSLLNGAGKLSGARLGDGRIPGADEGTAMSGAVKQLLSNGMSALPAGQVTALLRDAAGAGLPSAVVADIDWTWMSAQSPAPGVDRLAAEIPEFRPDRSPMAETNEETARPM